MSESRTFHKHGRGVGSQPGARSGTKVGEQETWELNYLHWETGWGVERIRKVTGRGVNVLAKILAVTYKDYLEIKRKATILEWPTPNPQTYGRK